MLLSYLQTIKVENMGDTILSLQDDRCFNCQLQMKRANPCCLALKIYAVVALLFSLSSLICFLIYYLKFYYPMF